MTDLPGGQAVNIRISARELQPGDWIYEPNNPHPKMYVSKVEVSERVTIVYDGHGIGVGMSSHASVLVHRPSERERKLP
jgi:hypothetical protein